jgi:acetylornithine/N-succinyldiaminopimelate aminotransferase
MSRQDIFLKHQAQTSPYPYLIDVAKAEGIYFWDQAGKRYMDMIAGVAVNNIGHRHPAVIDAIQTQLDKYLHVMVYGEFLQDSQLALAENLKSILPDQLNCSYIVNSGTEAIEAALKLAKRVTGRYELVSTNKSYHGSTHGSMSVSGNEVKKANFRPLLPAVSFITFNDIASLEIITTKTAGVLIETVQGDAGMRAPDPKFLKVLREKCNETGSLLIFDEVQVGMGRTGTMFAFEQYDVVPDILVLGKALGGGMPIGAMISSYENMNTFTFNPMLGHITTFGGHPVICAAANACINVLKTEPWIGAVEQKGQLLEDMITSHPDVIEIRRKGLFFAIELGSFERVQAVVNHCLENGLIGFWFLSCPTAFRLSPPLSISIDEIKNAGHIILEALSQTR